LCRGGSHRLASGPGRRPGHGEAAVGPIAVVAHRRIGRGGVPFWMIKVRTMWGPGDSARKSGWMERLRETSVPASKSEPDPRITSRFAALCRRFSLDELPQLVHVITGEMRLVGPRPLTLPELREHYGESMQEVVSVLPGITGLWQVLGRSRLTYHQRRRLDVFMVRRFSAKLYFWVLLRTPARVLTGRDAS